MNDQSHNNFSVIPEVGFTEIEGEPRARDIEIGERLGFSRPRDIRSLIDSNRGELEHFGVCVATPQTSGAKGGRPTMEYWLNEEQVLLVASLSKAPHAPAVRSMLIRVFVAWRRGHMESTSALPADVIEYIRRTDGISRMLSHKVTEMEKVLATAMQAVSTIATIVQPPHPILIRHGQTAGQIWQAAGFPTDQDYMLVQQSSD